MVKQPRRFSRAIHDCGKRGMASTHVDPESERKRDNDEDRNTSEDQRIRPRRPLLDGFEIGHFHVAMRSPQGALLRWTATLATVGRLDPHLICEIGTNPENSCSGL